MIAVACCRNSRHAVDEDDLKWVTSEKKIVIIFLETFRSKPLGSDMQNDALMHLDG